MRATWSALGAHLAERVCGISFGQEEERAAENLCGASISPDTEEQEGAFLGAMLRLRYGDTLKDKIRSILYRLKDILEHVPAVFTHSQRA